MTDPTLPEMQDKHEAIPRRNRMLKKISWLIILFCTFVIIMVAVIYGVRTIYIREIDKVLSALQTVQTAQSIEQAKLHALEEKLLEMRALQAPLEQSLLLLNRTREEVLLTDIEQLLDMTAQQLNLTGNVSSAIAALQGIDLRLSGLSKPRFASLRSAVRRDLSVLKAIRNIDMLGAAQKIDQVIADIDKLPLISSQHLEVVPSSMPQKKPEMASDWLAWGQHIWQSIKVESLHLLRIRRIDDPVALLLSPDQAWFVRESLTLRLLNARVALLIRSEHNFRTELRQAEAMLKRYFDMQSASTQQTQILLQDVQNNVADFRLPALTSISTLQQIKAY